MILQCVESTDKATFYGKLMYLGVLVFGLSMVLQGPAPFMPDVISILCIGIALGGIGGALINNNSTSTMYLQEKQAYLALINKNTLP